MFGIDSQRNMIIQLPVFLQPYTQTRLILYQIDKVLVPVLDTNYQAQSYTQLKIDKPYIALDEETYITLHPQKLNICKKNRVWIFLCKNCFLLKARIDIAVPVLYILFWDLKLLKKTVGLIFTSIKLM